MGRIRDLCTRCWWAALSSVIALACATPKLSAVRAPSPSQGFSDHALGAAAEAARARAAQAASDEGPGVVRSVQFRGSRLSAREFEEGTGGQGAVRVMLERPWRVSSQRAGGALEHDSATSAASAAELRARALTCDESVQGRAAVQRQTLARAYTEKLERVLAWTTAVRDAGTLDPITATRTDLLLQRKLLDEIELNDGARVHDTLGLLPQLELGHAVDLDLDRERLLERIRAEHPRVRAHLQAAERQRKLSAAELGRRIPWLDFVELGYGLEGQGLRDLQARFAIEIPLDDGSRGRARRLSELAVAEEYEAESEAALLTQQATLALQALQSFQAQSARLSALSGGADQAEMLALRFMEARRDSPDKVAQLLAESHTSRLLVLEAQARAGRASCSLEWATGTSYADWPRVSATR